MTTPVPFHDLDDLIEFLRKTDIGGDADKLWMHLEAATEAVEGWHNIGPLVTREFEERAASTGRSLMLVRTPVVNVTTATNVASGVEIDGDSLMVDKVAGIVSGLCGTFDVEYTAGRGDVDNVPFSLKLAVLVIASHIWEIQRGPRSRNFVGQASSDETGGHKAASGYLIPNRAAHLMQPYASVLVG